MRFLLAALLWLITLSSVDVASAETPEQQAKQCQRGSAKACVNLGAMYADGTGVKKDSVKAVELYRKACDGQEAEGCFNLGLMYEQGIGVTQDDIKAVALYRKACDGKFATGCFGLGMMYQLGTGVTQDYAKAVKFYRKACDAQEALGCINLAIMYDIGSLGVTPDAVKAVEFYRKACDANRLLTGATVYAECLLQIPGYSQVTTAAGDIHQTETSERKNQLHDDNQKIETENRQKIETERTKAELIAKRQRLAEEKRRLDAKKTLTERIVPSLDDFLRDSRPLNPTFTDEQLVREWAREYGQSLPVPTERTRDEFIAESRPLNPTYTDQEISQKYDLYYGKAPKAEQGNIARGFNVAMEQLPLLPFLVILVIFCFLFFLLQQKRQKEQQEGKAATQQPYPWRRSMRNWKRISAEEAKRHPLYGVRGWLSSFALVLVVGLIQQCQPIAIQAFHDGGPANWWAVNIPIVRALKFALVICALAAIIIYWLFFSRHRSFRPVSSCILLSIWPAQALRGFLDPSPAVVDALGLSFLTYVFHCAVGVTYLQRSKRVRVTFEHSVKVGQDNVAGSSQLSSASSTTDVCTGTSAIDTPPEETDQKVGAPKPAITLDPVLGRQFNDASTESHEQATPPGASQTMSSTQPTANPTVPVSILAEPSQSTADAHEERLYAQIAQELDTKTVDQGLWTKTYAQAGGDDQQTRVLYIRARLARLVAMEDAQREAMRREQQKGRV